MRHSELAEESRSAIEIPSGADFVCYSTIGGDCEALDEREEQMNSTLFLYVYLYVYRQSRVIKCKQQKGSQID